MTPRHFCMYFFELSLNSCEVSWLEWWHVLRFQKTSVYSPLDIPKETPWSLRCHSWYLWWLSWPCGWMQTQTIVQKHAYTSTSLNHEHDCQHIQELTQQPMFFVTVFFKETVVSVNDYKRNYPKWLTGATISWSGIRTGSACQSLKQQCEHLICVS